MDLQHTLGKVAHRAGCDLVIGPVAFEFVRDGEVLERVRFADRPSPTKLLAKLKGHDRQADKRARQELRRARQAEAAAERARQVLDDMGAFVKLRSRSQYAEKVTVTLPDLGSFVCYVQHGTGYFLVQRRFPRGRQKTVLSQKSRLRARVIRIWRLATIAGII